MSNFGQQRSTTSPQQAPATQQQQQGGPAPQAQDFSADTAVDYQATYGNAAVQEMAGIPSQGGQASRVGDYDPTLGADVDNATRESAALLARSEGWCILPTMAADVGRRLGGLSSLHDALTTATADFEEALATEGADVDLMALDLADLADRTQIASDIAFLYERLLDSGLQGIGAALGRIGSIAALSVGVTVHLVALREAAQRIVDAEEALAAAQSDIAETGVQLALQTALGAIESGFEPVLFAAGPAGWAAVVALKFGTATLSGVADSQLGREPNELVGALGTLEASTLAGVGILDAAGMTLSKVGKLGDYLGPVGELVNAVDAIAEVGAAMAAVREAAVAIQEATRDYQTAQEALQSFVDEVVPGAIEELAALAELSASCQADIAEQISLINELDAIYGGGLYTV